MFMKEIRYLSLFWIMIAAPNESVVFRINMLFSLYCQIITNQQVSLILYTFLFAEFLLINSPKKPARKS